MLNLRGLKTRILGNNFSGINNIFRVNLIKFNFAAPGGVQQKKDGEKSKI